MLSDETLKQFLWKGNFHPFQNCILLKNCNSFPDHCVTSSSRSSERGLLLNKWQSEMLQILSFFIIWKMVTYVVLRSFILCNIEQDIEKRLKGFHISKITFNEIEFISTITWVGLLATCSKFEKNHGIQIQIITIYWNQFWSSSVL